MNNPIRILILEDSPDDTELILLQLRRSGFTPIWVRVETESDFLAQLLDRVEVILSDYSMPQFNAQRALQLLQERCLDIPLIVVGGTINEEVAVECIDRGAADYLLKDRLARLGPAVRAALQAKQLRDEKRKAQADLRESEARFRRLAENTLDAIFRYRLAPTRCLEYINPAVTAITGYAPEDYANTALSCQLVHPDDWWLLEESLNSDRPTKAIVLRWLCKDGTSIYMETRSLPVFDEAGNLIAVEGISRRTSVANRDVVGAKPSWSVTTRRERLHCASLKPTENTQGASEEQFRQFAENIHQILWISSPDSRQVIYISPAYEAVWGRTCQSVYDRPQSWLESVYPEDRQAVISGGKILTQGHPIHQEFRIVLPNGSIRWIWNRAFPIRNEAGKVYRIAGIAEDITERKHSEEEMRKALETEKELNDLKSRFVSMVSHEFRNPLTAILMSVELLEHFSDRASEEKKSRYFARIKSAAKQMTDLLENVLVIGRAEVGKLAFEPAPLDLEAFCRALVEEMQLSAGYLHVINFVSYFKGAREQRSRDAGTPETLQSSIPTPPSQIPSLQFFPCLDEKLVWHILSNLLSNAIKYSPQGGTVQLMVSCRDDEVVFEIADEGIGIPLDDRPYLFESFHRAANVGKIPGTGLGLAIVKKAVEIHGGTIAVHSEVGVGTTFTVRLPVREP